MKQNGSRPEGTMEDFRVRRPFRTELFSDLHPATMWLANFRLSLRDGGGFWGIASYVLAP